MLVIHYIKTGSSVHNAPATAGSGEGRFMQPYPHAERLFPQLEPLTSRLQLRKLSLTPKPPSLSMYYIFSKEKKKRKQKSLSCSTRENPLLCIGDMM